MDEQMKLKLTRKYFSDNSTIGVLQIDGGISMFTLEDFDRGLEKGGTKVKGATCIPRGSYKVVLDFSNRFQKIMPHILDVPQFEGVRIHPGNTDKDTEGCPLVGGNKGDDFVGNSRVTYDQLMILLNNANSHGEEISLEIV
jgi:hypothetical protein